MRCFLWVGEKEVYASGVAFLDTKESVWEGMIMVAVVVKDRV